MKIEEKLNKVGLLTKEIEELKYKQCLVDAEIYKDILKLRKEILNTYPTSGKDEDWEKIRKNKMNISNAETFREVTHWAYDEAIKMVKKEIQDVWQIKVDLESI